MPDYVLIRWIHVAAATLSIAGFVLRFAWMIIDSPRRATRVARVLPHIVDTILLGSAIVLAVMAGVAPWTADWLGYKVIALLVYIVLGAIALKRGRTLSTRIGSGVAAIVVFASIVWVALNKTLPFS